MSIRTKLEILLALAGVIAILFSLYTHEIRKGAAADAINSQNHKALEILQERELQSTKAKQESRKQNDNLKNKVEHALSNNPAWSNERTPADVVSSMCNSGIRCSTSSP